MPKYQYQCKDCGEALEVQQSFTDDALTVCPTCGGDLRKVFNAVGVVFKGSGFYRNDSRPTSSSAPGGDSKDSAKPATVKDGSSGSSSTSNSKASSSTSSASPAKKSGTDSAA